MRTIRYLSVPVAAVVALAIVPTTAATAVTAENLSAAAGDRCLDLTDRQLDSATVPTGESAIPCNQPHNFEGVAVLEVPDEFARYGRMSMAARAWVNLKCVVAARKYAGFSIPTHDWRPYFFMDNKSDWNSGSHLALCGGVRYDWSFDRIMTSYGSIRNATEVNISCGRLRDGRWSVVRCRGGKDYYWAKEVPLARRGLETMAWPGAKVIMARAAKLARINTRKDQPGGRYAWWAETGKKWWNRGYNRHVYLYLHN